ncbi:Cytoplasmic 60S subunit biogenesis factor [Smittium mucronatum]|uniref:Cytoplasmic 60S subunit biogenesis factor n=1 Tax=Smittium mucronatum TaxID=133383 RepID=A0A1R0H887_9FUNG|nr:Cytoplasmic 60S subunit biogenesis factor [Smittium mucronatum]
MDMSIDPTSIFTCLACQVAFHTSEQQRGHYQTDWHRYNLKRKVVQLPPVTAEGFAQRLLAQKNKAAEDEKSNTGADCKVCRKYYSSKNAFDNHLKSKKHKENELAYVKDLQKQEDKLAISELINDSQENVEFPVSEDESESDSLASKPSAQTLHRINNLPLNDDLLAEIKSHRLVEKKLNKELDAATDQAEILNLIEKKMKIARRLDIGDCLFCNVRSSDLKKNISHMEVEHSFFIPDSEYLVDLKGLIEYLGEKITVANVCIYCNGRGRGLRSLEAVRNHMNDLGHCKIAYDTEIDILEISDFYDFSSSYPEGVDYSDISQGVLDSQTDGNSNTKRALPGQIYLEEEDGELILPNGNRIGHRSLKHIYDQNLTVTEEKESIQIHRMLTNIEPESEENAVITSAADRSKLAVKSLSDGRSGPRSKAVILALPGGKRIWRDMMNVKDKKIRSDFSARIGIKANGLQKYFRQQNPI